MPAFPVMWLPRGLAEQEGRERGPEADLEEVWGSAGLSVMATGDLTFPRPGGRGAQEGSPRLQPRVAPTSLCAPWAREGLGPRQAQGSPLPPSRPPGEEVSEYSSTSCLLQPRERSVRTTPPQTLPLLCPPSSLCTGGPGCWPGVPSRSRAGHAGRWGCHPSPVSLRPARPAVCPRPGARLPGRPAPRAAAGLGEPAPQTLTPRRGSPSSSRLRPQGEGGRRCCGAQIMKAGCGFMIFHHMIPEKQQSPFPVSAERAGQGPWPETAPLLPLLVLHGCWKE
ncbi:translation initiation factor IF-2-like [Cervus elaphus]|uniref:translation initiation factor IF-2-like n=1 Tax=Cervus elaphus TaxID=9860 RepID=UPI001CC2907F|nr:translation initiation factor IF-2-like [Cervus elaphus]